jgi:hypothetical protein
MMDETFDGQCFCGKLRYRMHGRPMFIHCCHCRDCQQQVGSAFAVNGLIEADRLELIEGEPVAVAMRTDSGHPHDIYRCEACQSPLWSDYGKRGWLLFLRMATLDRAAEFMPDVHIYTRSKLPWVVLPEGARAFEEYYSSKAEWPEESIARREAARAKAGAVR